VTVICHIIPMPEQNHMKSIY